MIVTERCLDANCEPWSVLPYKMREELCDWLCDHGIDPHTTASVELDLIDAPLIRIERYLENETGHRYLDPATNDAAKVIDEVFQRTAPPAWWQP